VQSHNTARFDREHQLDQRLTVLSSGIAILGKKSDVMAATSFLLAGFRIVYQEVAMLS
jgi:hypothetical protein